MTTASVAGPAGIAPAGQPPAGSGAAIPRAALRPVCASKLEMLPVRWLWPGRIPHGLLTYLAGEPGLGKSLLSLVLVAKLSTGELNGPAANSLILSAEDARAHVVLPRLLAAGADLERVFFPPLDADGFEEQLRLPDDLDRLREHIDDVKARFVVIDPLVAHLPVQVNSWQDQSVRTALAPLHHLAAETGAAFLLIGHLNKGDGSNPLRRIGGSIGIPAAARSVLLLARDPDDTEGEAGALRVLAHVKCNVGSHSPSLAYTIEPTRVGADSEIETVRLLERGLSRLTGSELLGDQQREPSKLEQTIRVLESELADGPKPVAELQTKAAELRVSETTLERAKQDLGLLSRKPGLNDGWAWELPETINGESPNG